MAKDSNTNSLTIKHVKSILIFFVFIVLCIHGNAQTKTLSINKDTIFIVIDTLTSKIDTIIVKADSLSPKLYTYIGGVVDDPKITKRIPPYITSSDQNLLLLKGPVVGVKNINSMSFGSGLLRNDSIGLDDNGWILPVYFDDVYVERDNKHRNRIVKITAKEEDYEGGHSSKSYRYDEENMLIEWTDDTVEGTGVGTIRHNTYHDPLSLAYRCRDGWLGNLNEIYYVTRYDCFHNWLERDVVIQEGYDDYENFIKGAYHERKVHEKRILYYKSVLSRDDLVSRFRPWGTPYFSTINSETGGYICYKMQDSDWKYYRVYGVGEKPEMPKRVPFIISVLERPSFLGGYKKLNEYIADSIQYPIEAIQNKIEGKVKVRFKIDRLGHISNAKVVKGLSPELDKEAIRLVNAMPSWTPAKRNGKLVSVYYTLPITFSLNKNKRIIKSKP